MSNSYFIALTLGMAAVTFLIRFSFIGLAGKIQMSERVTKTLRFVPVTVSDPPAETCAFDHLAAII
ncbi:L-asparagine permease [Klebsiella pneumoniae]|nr:L-asparagine permease [Klebsiella pneumoniae]